MNPDNRPYIEFERTVNRGLTPRKDTEKRSGHPGEFKETNFRKHLISHRAPFDAYSWVSAEWVTGRQKAGWIPVGYGNMDKLPADYPAEWRRQLNDAIGAVKQIVDSTKALNETIRAQQAEIERLKAERGGANEDSGSGESGESDRPATEGRKGTSRKAG